MRAIGEGIGIDHVQPVYGARTKLYLTPLGDGGYVPGFRCGVVDTLSTTMANLNHIHQNSVL